MNPNNSNSVSANSDSIFQEEPGFEKVKTLSKILMISRGDYRLFSYLGQQCYAFESYDTLQDELKKFCEDGIRLFEDLSNFLDPFISKGDQPR
jgi:hypothetical protein